MTVGFGLSDPDFDLLLSEFERSFGTVPREPIVITKTPVDSLEQGRRTALRRQFGVRFLNVATYAELPGLFKQVESEPGARVESLLDMCTSPSREVRHEAHRELERLSNHGRQVLKRWILVRLAALRVVPPDRQTVFALSELMYSIKVLGALSRQEAEVIRNVVDTYTHYDPPAIGLLALQSYYPADADRGDYERWLGSLDSRVDDLSRMPSTFGFANFPERHKAYLGTLRTYLQAKTAKNTSPFGP